MNERDKEQLQEWIALYHSDMLRPEERARVEAWFERHPEARAEADSYAAAVRLMQKGGRQIPRVEGEEWAQIIGGMQNKLESESVLTDADLSTYVPDPTPMALRILRVAAAVLLLCGLSYGGYRVFVPAPPAAHKPDPETTRLQQLAEQRLAEALPDPENLRTRKILQSTFQDKFLVDQTRTVKMKITANPVDMEDAGKALVIEGGSSSAAVMWILEEEPAADAETENPPAPSTNEPSNRPR